jgi:glycosyltransferase involved in cell wall biosynthesis
VNLNVPKISVIVPIYNVEKYLKECLDSILLQTFSDFELILVNDCSSDDSATICKEYASKDTRIKLVNKPQNEGLPLARKTGFENSVGNFIINIDGDDWVEHTILDILYCVATKENADLVCCDFFRDYQNKYEYTINVVDTNNTINNLGFKNYSAIWSYLFRRDLYEKIKFPSYSIAEDRVITQQALFYSKKLCKIPYPLYHYRINPNSMMQNLTEKKWLEHQQNTLWVIDFLKEHLQNDFVMLENNINFYVNSFKYSIINDKNLRKNKTLYNFYPESNFGKYIVKKKLMCFFDLMIPKFLKLILKYIIRKIHNKKC